MVCLQLRKASTCESLFWILPHSSDCTHPTYSRLTRYQGGEGGTLVQWCKAEMLELLPSHSWGPGKLVYGCSVDPGRNARGAWPHTFLPPRCNHPCTRLSQNGVVSQVEDTGCNL